MVREKVPIQEKSNNQSMLVTAKINQQGIEVMNKVSDNKGRNKGLRLMLVVKRLYPTKLLHNQNSNLHNPNN